MQRTHPLGTLKRAASSIRRLITRERRDEGRREEPRREIISEPPHARAPRRDTDIPFDRIEQTYTPTQTSLKGPFRASGADRGRDQELAEGVADDRWKDEDRFTNKSGDPRIGTHGRTYEPGER
jgi:hypothetical protein